MTAKEFREFKEFEYGHFQELTKTGITPDYKEIDEFAKAYAEQQIKELKEVNDMKAGVELITDERKRQVEKEGWTPEHDAEHGSGQLALAASCYARPDDLQIGVKNSMGFHGTIHRAFGWPWSVRWWKPTPDDRVRELVKAGALIAAEIDRLHNKH